MLRGELAAPGDTAVGRTKVPNTVSKPRSAGTTQDGRNRTCPENETSHPSRKGGIAVVIPALNEEPSIPLVLGDLPVGWVDQVVVVDNGSRDRTAEVVRADGATVVDEPRRGYGSACLRGLAELRGPPRRASGCRRLPRRGLQRSSRGIAVAGSTDPGRGLRFRAQIAAGRAPRAGCDAAAERLGQPSGLLPDATPLRAHYTDLGPFRAIRWDALERLGMCDRDFGWTIEMQIKAVRHGLRIREIPVSYRRRVGKSKISGMVVGTIRAGSKILLTIARHGWRPGSVKPRMVRGDGREPLHATEQAT